jgi:hypothetical protein
MRRVLVIVIVGTALWAARRHIRDALVRITGTNVVTVEPVGGAALEGSRPAPGRGGA